MCWAPKNFRLSAVPTRPIKDPSTFDKWKLLHINCRIFCFSYDVWCDQINQCIDEIDPNNFKSHGAIFAIFFTPKTPYFLDRTHKILTQRTSPAAWCRPLAALCWNCVIFITTLITFSKTNLEWRHRRRWRHESNCAQLDVASQLELQSNRSCLASWMPVLVLDTVSLSDRVTCVKRHLILKSR